MWKLFLTFSGFNALNIVQEDFQGLCVKEIQMETDWAKWEGPKESENPVSWSGAKNLGALQKIHMVVIFQGIDNAGYRGLFLEPPPSLNMMEWLVEELGKKKGGKSEPETSLLSATSELRVLLQP